ncbi:Putative triple helix repeat-containing collagen (plasmid) [Sporosarcina sp. ANT_H38]|uniref:collagen-like protein n=2 Tax=unclassified Sporosarcina TaxID=2647733 RepID=UPI00159B2643|nr:collagen-like protein [Sporosarcina sp. ANT_H38]QJS06561.1 putative triple helix repeat-containing collagen [Sporosarcina sp.]
MSCNEKGCKKCSKIYALPVPPKQQCICPPGPQGQPGTPGGILAYADFYALMPGDNSATVAVGADVDFPSNGPTSGTNIVRAGIDSFTLSAIGTYQVLFQVSVTEPGQLILTLNNTDLAYTVVGRATGTSQIVGMALVETTVANSILTVRNPTGNSTALTITPLAGGTRSVSAHLVITQLQ